MHVRPFSPSSTRVSKRRPLASIALLLILAIAPLAFAQTAKKPKKGAKPAPSASASASASAEPEPAPPPPPPPKAEPEPSAASGGSGSAEGTEAAAPAEGELSPDDPQYVKEDPQKKYYFVGLRYRGNVIPQFMENLFVDEGGTFYSNSIAAELDMRQDGRSMIPWISYADYGAGDTLFLQKGKDPSMDSNYSVVNSQLKAIYLGLDELWSMPVANHLDFEFGFGVGIGFVFGNLQNNWVYQNAAGNLTAANGMHLKECPSENLATTCNQAAHQNSTEQKWGGYVEKNWFNGGSVPVVFPHISIPQFSLRYKPFKQAEGRLSAGFSITGFWFGLSIDYGLEKSATEEKPTEKGKGKHKDKDKEKDKDAGDKDTGGGSDKSEKGN